MIDYIYPHITRTTNIRWSIYTNKHSLSRVTDSAYRARECLIQFFRLECSLKGHCSKKYVFIENSQMPSLAKPDEDQAEAKILEWCIATQSQTADALQYNSLKVVLLATLSVAQDEHSHLRAGLASRQDKCY